jgi:hypothetical protein
MESAHGFFNSRRQLRLGRIDSGDNKNYANYKNVPPSIGAVVSKGLAKLHELDTIYGTQDLYDMLEILIVDNYNIALSRQT